MLIGAHVSTAGGLPTCVPRAIDLQADCMQIFLSAPQRWLPPKHTVEQIAEFQRRVTEANIGPTFAHAIYLVNLATADPAMRTKSIESLSVAAAFADRIGLAGVVIHVGSFRGQSIEEAEIQVAGALEEVLAKGTTSGVILENSAGSGELLGSRFQQIGSLFDRLGRDKRLGLCMDTAHTFASGYDLRVADGIERTVDEISRYIGLERLKVIHANDSKVDLTSFVDRHENIGKGRLGEAGLRRLLAHPALQSVPWVTEAPGYDNKGPDLQNVLDLKRLAGET
jgi:deoxyribonuclease-4